MTRFISQVHPDHVSKPLPIPNGGTGAKTGSNALQNLTAVPAATIGQPAGPVPLGADTKIPAIYLPDTLQGSNNEPTLSGPSKVYIGAVRRFFITNYDINLSYTVSISRGTVVLNHDVIEVTLPYDESLAGQTAILNVNGKHYTLNILASYIFERTPFTFQATSFHNANVAGVYQLVGGFGDTQTHKPRITIELYNDAQHTMPYNTIHDIDVNFTTTLILGYYSSITGLSSETMYYCRIRLEIITLTNDVIMAGPWTNGTIDTGNVSGG